MFERPLKIVAFPRPSDQYTAGAVGVSGCSGSSSVFSHEPSHDRRTNTPTVLAACRVDGRITARCGGLVRGGNDERDVVVTDQAGTTMATTRPSKLACPFTRWSLRKLT
jgi:hypothetical protein